MTQDAAAAAEPAPPVRRRFGPDRIAMVPVIFFALGALPVAASSPFLTWLLLLPVACGAWVLRARVVAAPVGVLVSNGLRATRVAWTDVEGFQVPRRGPVRLLRSGSRPLPMTALTRRDLPALLEVSRRAGT